MTGQLRLPFDPKENIPKAHKKHSETLQNMAGVIGVKYPQFIKTLTDRGILINTNGRNIPRTKYISMGWFVVTNTRINKLGFSALVSKVRITELGYKEMLKIFI